MDAMTTYYHQYEVPQIYNFPLMVTDWTPLCPNNYTVPLLPTVTTLPVAVPQIVTPVCPFTSVLVPDSVIPVISTVPLVVTPSVCNNLCSHVYETEFYNTGKTVSTEKDYPISDEVPYTEDVQKQTEECDKFEDKKYVNRLELYLCLPKELFPTARMLTIDPNTIIDEFCKLANIKGNVSWILDLEFGVPKVPITRPIAAYDVKFNSIHCKNTPGAIHPSFEKCNGDFKRAILFYYDCVVSNWYNGYVILKRDKSVENFQSWLQIPMQTFGMCWP